jgi:hypothetical protein
MCLPWDESAKAKSPYASKESAETCFDAVKFYSPVDPKNDSEQAWTLAEKYPVSTC